MALLLAVLVLLMTGCPARGAAPPSQGDLQLRARAILMDGLASDDPALQYSAARYTLALPIETLLATGEGNPSLADAVLARLKAPDTSLQTRQWLIDLIADSGWWKSLQDSSQDEALAWALADRGHAEMERREVAAYALWKLGGSGHMKDLIPLITDPERTVRSIVAEAFGKLGDGTEWPTLKRFAGDENEYVRLRAAKALANWLARLGPQLDKAEVTALLDQLKGDEDPFVRRMALQAYGIGIINDPLAYRTEIYSPALTTRTPEEGTEEWEFFRDTAIGNFEWSLGHGIPVPSEISQLVFQLLWEDHADLQRDILAAAARQAHPGESGFLQVAWESGDEGLQIQGLTLMREVLLERGDLGEELDETLRDIADTDLVEADANLRTAVVGLLLTLGRSQSIARFTPEEVDQFADGIANLYYTPRDSVKQLVVDLNPRHPWLLKAANSQFRNDETLRPHLPRLARMIWFGEAPSTIDPKTGEAYKTPDFPLTNEELDLLWKWGAALPAGEAALVFGDPANPPALDVRQVRAAALILRGETPLETAGAGQHPELGGEDWAEPEAAPRLPEGGGVRGV